MLLSRTKVKTENSISICFFLFFHVVCIVHLHLHCFVLHFVIFLMFCCFFLSRYNNKLLVFVSIITSVCEVEWVFNQNVNKEIFEWWCSKNCIHLKLISCEWKLNVNQYYAVNNTQQGWKSRSGRDYLLFFHPEYWNLDSPIFVIAKVFHFSTFTKHENKHSLTSEWKSRYLNWMIYLMHAFICFQFCVWISFFLFVRSIAENVKCKQPAIHTHTHSYISFFLMQWSTSKSMSLFMVKQNRRFCLCSFSNALRMRTYYMLPFSQSMCAHSKCEC